MLATGAGGALLVDGDAAAVVEAAGVVVDVDVGTLGIEGIFGVLGVVVSVGGVVVSVGVVGGAGSVGVGSVGVGSVGVGSVGVGAVGTGSEGITGVSVGAGTSIGLL